MIEKQKRVFALPCIPFPIVILLAAIIYAVLSAQNLDKTLFWSAAGGYLVIQRIFIDQFEINSLTDKLALLKQKAASTQKEYLKLLEKQTV